MTIPYWRLNPLKNVIPYYNQHTLFKVCVMVVVQLKLKKVQHCFFLSYRLFIFTLANYRFIQEQIVRGVFRDRLQISLKQMYNVKVVQLYNVKANVKRI